MTLLESNGPEDLWRHMVIGVHSRGNTKVDRFLNIHPGRDIDWCGSWRGRSIVG